MKLAFCLFRYFPYGGLQRSCVELIRLCLAHGHQVTVFTISWEGPVLAGIEVKLIPARGLTNHQRNIAFAKQVQTYLTGYDSIIGFNKIPGLSFYIAADPCYQAHAYKQHGRLYRLIKRYRSYVWLEASVFSETSTTEIFLLTARQALEFNYYYHTSPSRMQLLTPGIIKETRDGKQRKMIRQRLRERYAIPEGHNILLIVASAFKTKGLDRSLQAFASLPDFLQAKCHLWVIGDDDAKTYQLWAKRWKIADRIHFLGARNDVADYMLAADILLHPARVEAAGMVLLEALQAGMVVLTNAICGYATYIERAKAGIVLPLSFKQAELNAALRWLLQRPSLVKHMRANAIAYSGAMDLYSQYKQIVAHIERAHYPTSSVQAMFNPQGFYLTAEMGWIKEWNDVAQLTGVIYRAKEGRRTFRFDYRGKGYFAKVHTGIGWFEIIKNLFMLRWPILDASTEYRAIQALSILNIPTLEIMAYAAMGKNPATRKSFLITCELLDTISLEDFCRSWLIQRPCLALKRALIARLAEIARCMHSHGINHRDFYLCHFLLAKESIASLDDLRLYVIDLHRAQIRMHVPWRWLLKDLAGLLFSAVDLPLTRTDLAYFIKVYSAQPFSLTMRNQAAFWQCIYYRAAKLYRKIHAKPFPLKMRL